MERGMIAMTGMWMPGMFSHGFHPSVVWKKPSLTYPFPRAAIPGYVGIACMICRSSCCCLHALPQFLPLPACLAAILAAVLIPAGS
jgi:hypothetical protein